MTYLKLTDKQIDILNHYEVDTADPDTSPEGHLFLASAIQNRKGNTIELNDLAFDHLVRSTIPNILDICDCNDDKEYRYRAKSICLLRKKINHGNYTVK